MDPFGWRIASAVVGALMVLLMCRFVRRVTGSTVLGLVAGLLLSLDGLHLVLSRLALLDIFLAFFILCGVHCVVADRQWLRDRLAAGATRRLRGGGRGCSPAGVAFGLAFGTKWSALYTLAAFGLLAVAVERGRASRVRPAPAAAALGAPRRRAGLRRARRRRAGRRTSRRGPAGCCTPTPTSRRSATRSTRPTTAATPWPTASEPDADGLGEVDAVAALALVLPPGRLHLPQPLPQRLHPRLRLQARRRGW